MLSDANQIDLTPAAAACLRRMASGEHVGGHMAASLARRGLAEYAEHVDAWRRKRGTSVLTMRRGYTATALGIEVIRLRGSRQCRRIAAPREGAPC